MTPGQAEEMLREYRAEQAAAQARRRAMVLAALRAGLTKHRIHMLSGISRTTIDDYILKERK